MDGHATFSDVVVKQFHKFVTQAIRHHACCFPSKFDLESAEVFLLSRCGMLRSSTVGAPPKFRGSGLLIPKPVSRREQSKHRACTVHFPTLPMLHPTTLNSEPCCLPLRASDPPSRFLLFGVSSTQAWRASVYWLRPAFSAHLAQGTETMTIARTKPPW